MALPTWRTWLRLLSPSRNRRVPIRRRPTRERPGVEQLECRLAPATHTWTGGPFGNTNFNWSNAANWIGGVPDPSDGLDDLVFPANALPASLASGNHDLADGITFNTITFDGDDYTLRSLLNRRIAVAGPILVNSGVQNTTILLNVELAGVGGSQQDVTVNLGADLTISGRISGTTGVELTKSGSGRLTLRNDNSGFTGKITVEQGILEATHPLALGDFAATPTPQDHGTTVQSNAQLMLTGINTTINEHLIISGPGVSNKGALLLESGTTTWAGNIELDNDASIGATSNTLNITGQISDRNAGHNLTKEGAGRIIFSRDNTYRGKTTINNGILTIRHALALGAAGMTPVDNGTLVNSSATTGSATLQLEGLAGVGFTVLNEQLTLNGPGFDPDGAGPLAPLGALHNLTGNNVWAADVPAVNPSIILGSQAPNGSDVRIGVESSGGLASTLTVTGVVGDPNGIFNLTKIGPGRLEFTNSNTYRGTTTIAAGILLIRDSQGLGPAAAGGGTTVDNGAALELAVDALVDSVTGTTNTLRLTEAITINGRGINNTGALRSVSGINTWASTLALGTQTTVAAVGVDEDLTATANETYFISDDSLTVTGNIAGGQATQFSKVGDGHLILPFANTYTGQTVIERGWITIQNNESLGGLIAGRGDTAQPGTRVQSGAALHLRPLAPNANLEVAENLVLASTGITHPYALLSQKGALLSMAGNNVIGTYNPTPTDRRTSDIELVGNVGIGVQQLPGFPTSDLTITASISEAVPPPINLNSGASGFDQEDAQVIDTGSISGVITVNYNFYFAPDRLTIYYPPRSMGGTRIFDSGVVAGSASVMVNYGPGTSTFVEIVVNEGGTGFGTVWDYTATIQPSAGASAGGITKLGTRRLLLQGDATYTGEVVVSEGVLRVQHDTALGTPDSGTRVEPGAALELDAGIPENNGGISAGIQVWDEALTLRGTGNTTNGPQIHPLTNLSADAVWRGPITLATDVTIDVPTDTRLTVAGPIDDVPNAGANGSSLTKIGDGKLVLSAANTYRGLTDVQVGILNVQHGQALGQTTNGTVVADDAALELQGSFTVAGEQLTIQGEGVPLIPATVPGWFEQGPAPILNGQTPGGSNRNQQVTGRVTGVVVDPSDPDVIYISAAGGGAWKTEDSGKSWIPLFDAQNSAIFAGAIAIAPSDPRIIYLGTGEANNSADSYYGTGVWKSIDSGKTWTRLTQVANPNNPFDRKAISRIVVDPNDPNRIFVAASDLSTNGTLGGAGIWRFSGGSWVNMTAPVSVARQTLNGQLTAPPNTPGPDDDYRIVFPQTIATWSDLAIANGVLYAALGNAFTGLGIANNAVFRTPDLGSNQPRWFVGDGITDSRAGGFPHSFNTTGRQNGNIKLTAVGTTIYAATARPGGNFGLVDIQKSTNGGVAWADTTNGIPDYLMGQGWYNSTIHAVNANVVYVAGLAPGLRTTNGGGAWTDISFDASNNAPHVDAHALAADSTGRPIFGNDGGVWRWDPTSQLWENLNGNLAITTFNGLDAHPNDPNFLIGGSQDNGTEVFTGSQSWDHVDDGDGGEVHIDPVRPNIIYHVLNGLLRKSTSSGARNTWNTILNVTTSLYFDFLVDSVNSDRLLVASPTGTVATAVRESTDEGNTFVSLNFPGGGVDSIAAAAYQGAFTFDPGFDLVTDQGANTYDPDTIWVSTGDAVWVTKNHGTTWVNRTGNLPGSFIADLIVDPRNRDTAYVVRNTFDNLGRKIYKTTTAGRDPDGVGPLEAWTDITGGIAGTPGSLPNVPTWTMVLDPRDNALYVGNDDGVYQSTDGGATWARFGAGLPQVQVKHMVLNQAQDSLVIGSYGRSAFRIYLDHSQANAGVLRSLSGSAVWTGSVRLAADSVISAAGTQALQNGVSAAQLTIVGPISELTPGNTSRLTKIGGGDVILSGTNTYGGVTHIKEGVLRVQNPSALGSPAQGTIVDPGTALELLSSINGEPLELFGDGFQFNDHFTGALRNISSNNTYSGPITLRTNATIGVNSGSQLTITGLIDDGAGVPLHLTKELTGTLVLNPTAANTYDGTTFIEQGVLRVMHGMALGTTTNGTQVRNGAQIQIQGGITVPTESLVLSGTGIFGTGALLNSGGNNIWQGPLTLASISGFAPVTAPPATVSIGVSSASDSLTLDTPIGEALATGISKVGPGKLVFTRANNYSGSTYIVAGVLNIQDGGALGSSAANEIQRITLGGSNTGDFTVTFNGFTTPALPFSATDAQLQTELNNLQSIGGLMPAGGVMVTRSGDIFTVTFLASMAGVNQNQLSAAGLNGSTAAASTAADGGIGTLVNPGTALELQTAGAGFTVPAELLVLNGDGIAPANAGGLRNVAGSNTWGGPVTLASSSSIGTDAGTTLAVTGTVNGAATANLTKVGTGTLVLPNANNYLGLTLVQAGILNIRNALALGPAGPNGTQVFSGATLQVQGSIPVSTESLRLSGPGFDPDGAGALPALGALHSVSGDNTWSGAIALNGDSAIGAETGSKLTLDTGITELIASKLTKIGLGTVVFTGSASNTYTGLTQVNAGTLQLDKSGGAFAIPANLTVGDGAAPSALVEFLNNNDQLTTTATVIVNSDGTFNLNDHTQTLALLQILDGIASTGLGALGVLTLTPVLPLLVALDMVGGTFTLGNAVTSQLVLNGNVTAASSAVGLALIQGTGATPGVLLLNGADRTFTVGDGPNANTTDLRTTAPIAGTVGLVKAGAGLMEIDSLLNTYAGTTTVSAGTLQVDGVITSNVSLNGGTLAGTGTVGNITSTATGGSVAPGNSAGTLTSSGAVTWNNATNFNVELTGPSAGQFDVLDVTTTIDLGGANLVGSVTGFTPTTDGSQVFTIINAPGGRSGTFAQGTTAYLSGMKFNIVYGATFVQLTRVEATTTTAITQAAPNASTFGDLVTFTARVTPEAGATFGAPPSGMVTFFDGANPLGSANLVPDAGGFFATATFTTTAADQLTGGSHTITAVYDGSDPDFLGDTSDPVTQTVNQAQTLTTLTNASPSSPQNFGTPVTFTATVTPLVGTAIGTTRPQGFVTFFDNGNPLTPPQPLQNIAGVMTATYTTADDQLTGGDHNITAVYDLDEVSIDDDTNFRSSTSPSILYTVNKRGTTSEVFLAVPAGSQTFGQQVTFTARVLPTTGATLPTGTVTFMDGATVLGTVPLQNVAGEARASFTANQSVADQLKGGSHNIQAQYNPGTDPNHLGSNSANFSYTITPATTFTTVTTAVPSPSNFSQTVTFTAIVTPTIGTTLPTGTVNFFDGMTFLGSGTLADNGSGMAAASYQTTPGQLSVTSHNITAQYIPTPVSELNYSGSTSGVFTHNVNPSPTTTAIILPLSPSSSIFGNLVTFTARVTPSVGGVLPTGTVEFRDGGNLLGTTGSLTNNGGFAEASFTTTSIVQLLGGARNITATYVPAITEGNFVGSTSVNFVHTVNEAGTTTTVTQASPVSPSIFGTQVMFTATVIPAIGGILPTGSVSFFDDGNLLGSGTLSNVSGTATATFTTAVDQLKGGPHNITAVYDSPSTDANYATSTSNAFPYTVNRLATSTTINLASPPTPSPFGTLVTFTAQVTPTIGGTLPTGTVTFMDGANILGVGNLVDVGSIATASFTTDADDLSVGSHQISAVYTPAVADLNFQGSTSASITYDVFSRTSTTTLLIPSPSPATFGQQVTLRAQVTPNTGSVQPTGTVTFLDGTTILGGGILQNVGGVATATFVTNFTQLNAGGHSITAVYNPGFDPNYQGSTSLVRPLTVNPVSTTTTINSTHPPPYTVGSPAPVFGQVVVTATVNANIATAGTPTGFVTFNVDGTDRKEPLVGNIATLTLQLSPGDHNIAARYDADEFVEDDNPNFAGSGPSNLAQTVRQASSNTGLTVTSLSGVANSFFNGEPVTLTAVIGAQAPGAGIPNGGTVNFLDNGTLLGSATVVGGVATFVATRLGSGVHNFRANFLGNTNFLASFGTGTATNLGAAIVVTTTRFKGRPQLRVINRDGSTRFETFPFEASYRGGLRLATGDMNGDGFPEVVVVSVTRSQRLVIYDGRTGARLQVIRLGRLAKDRAVFAAVGDLFGDGRAEIIVGMGGVLRGYNGLTGQRLFTFRPFGRTSPKTMRVVALDVNNDGLDEIFALLGSPSSPQVKGYNGRTLAELPASVYADALPTIIARSNQ